MRRKHSKAYVWILAGTLSILAALLAGCASGKADKPGQAEGVSESGKESASEPQTEPVPESEPEPQPEPVPAPAPQPGTVPAPQQGVASGSQSGAGSQPQTPLPSGPLPANQTLKSLLAAAMEPVGRCLYVWGGGWNREDTGAGEEAMRLGVSPGWYSFFQQNGSDYDYQKTEYQIHDGLDCSGFVGYVVYQAFENRYSSSGYVFKSSTIPARYRALFGGEYRARNQVRDYCPGDVMGGNGHVFLVVGSCADGSMLFVHASPPVVSLCGTPTPGGVLPSEATTLAARYMAAYRPESYSRYDSCSRGTDFLKNYDQFRWDPSVLPDPDGYRGKGAEEILADLFPENP